MYKNRAEDGRNNICGKNVKRLRQGMAKKTSQRMLAYLLQMKGLDVDNLSFNSFSTKNYTNNKFSA